MSEEDIGEGLGREMLEGQFPPLIDDAREAHMILAEKLYSSTSPKLRGCTSYIHRKMQCSYNHASAIIQLMEEKGWITPVDKDGARELRPQWQSP